MEVGQATAIKWIRNPVGSEVPYDFREPEHLKGFLRDDVGKYRIARMLEKIVDEVTGGETPQLVEIGRKAFERQKKSVLGMLISFQDYLTTPALLGLNEFMVGILSVKYVPKEYNPHR